MPGSAKKGRRKGAKATSAHDGAAAPPALAPSYNELACEYHAAMVAGLSLICARSCLLPSAPSLTAALVRGCRLQLSVLHQNEA